MLRMPHRQAVSVQYPPPFCPSNAYIQATLGVGSVNFCTVDFGHVFFNSFYCVPCVLLDTLVLRSTKLIFCVKAALLAKWAFVACVLPLGFQNSTSCLHVYHTSCGA